MTIKLTKIAMAVAAFALAIGNVKAQMGWTLEQCRSHFGQCEIEGSTAYFRLNAKSYIVEGLHRWSGRQVWLTFDPDGAVGKIQWLKAPGSVYTGEGFSEAEVQQHLREASRVSWKRVNPVPNEEGELSWTGEQHGKVIFDANEDDNGRGTVFLTITTR